LSGNKKMINSLPLADGVMLRNGWNLPPLGPQGSLSLVLGTARQIFDSLNPEPRLAGQTYPTMPRHLARPNKDIFARKMLLPRPDSKMLPGCVELPNLSPLAVNFCLIPPNPPKGQTTEREWHRDTHHFQAQDKENKFFFYAREVEVMRNAHL
jgi:hypothetical protein